jgi:hypothetical protein
MTKLQRTVVVVFFVLFCSSFAWFYSLQEFSCSSLTLNMDGISWKEHLFVLVIVQLTSLPVSVLYFTTFFQRYQINLLKFFLLSYWKNKMTCFHVPLLSLWLHEMNQRILVLFLKRETTTKNISVWIMERTEQYITHNVIDSEKELSKRERAQCRIKKFCLFSVVVTFVLFILFLLLLEIIRKSRHDGFVDHQNFHGLVVVWQIQQFCFFFRIWWRVYLSKFHDN